MQRLLPALRWLCLGSASLLAACGGGDGDDDGPPTNPPTLTCSAAGIAASNASTAPNTVCMLTSEGEIVVELYPDQAPFTVANFLKYVDDDFYSNTLFHRVVEDFVVQGGGYATNSAEKPPTYAAIPLESNNGLSNARGTIAMARTDVPDSATSQFYFNTVTNTRLDYSASVGGKNGYAVFGKIISGLAVIDAINEVETDSADVPRTNVILYWTLKLK